MARVLIVQGHARSLGIGPMSVILTDMDGFAEVNDRCGYAVGDRLLQAFAGLLHEPCRCGDTVARLEAEAFLLLLPGTKLDAAWYVAERVRRRTAVIGAALGPDGPALTASFGVAEHRPPTPGATSSTAPKPPSPEPNEPAVTAARSPDGGYGVSSTMALICASSLGRSFSATDQTRSTSISKYP
jgi:diguanylate cyclase (GGDEF)-like protein